MQTSNPQLVVTAGDKTPWMVEYDIDFPVNATYTIHVRYTASEPRPLALDHSADALRPQPGDSKPRTVHYAADIRPLLDKHCVSCHGTSKPEGGLELTGGLTKLYDRSYENLIERGLLGNLNDGDCGSANVAPEPPLTFGSHQSRLAERIREAPCKANLTREECIRIVTTFVRSSV